MMRVHLLLLLACCGLAAEAAAANKPAAAAAAAAAASPAGPFESPGPCRTRSDTFVTKLDKNETGCRANECLVQITITTPDGSRAANGGSGGGCPPGPWPVVEMFNGFSARGEFYSYLADHLASYGYGAVQHTFVAALIVEDARELKMMPAINAAAKARAPAGALDWAAARSVVGHSRGAKLAALTVAGAPQGAYAAAVLVDPVDNTVFSPEGPLYPSAVKALAALQPPATAAVIGSGVVSACNPLDANYDKFYSALGAGSWRVSIPGATHQDFADFFGVPLPPVCGKSTTPVDETRALTKATAAAWIEGSVRGASVAGFEAWITSQPASLVQFTVKA